MDALYNAKTNFAGLLDKAAAIRFNLASQADDETSEQAVDAVKLLREQAEVGLGDLDTGDDAMGMLIRLPQGVPPPQTVCHLVSEDPGSPTRW